MRFYPYAGWRGRIYIHKTKNVKEGVAGGLTQSCTPLTVLARDGPAVTSSFFKVSLTCILTATDLGLFWPACRWRSYVGVEISKSEREDPSHPSQSGCSHLARYDLLLVLDREAKNRLAEKDHCKWRRRPVHSTTCQRLASVQVRHEMYRCCCRCVLLHALSNTHEHDGVPAERPEVVLTLAKNQAVNMQVRLFFRPWCAGTAGPQFCILQMQCAPGPRRLFCFGVACTVHFAVSGWTLSRFRPILEPLCLAYLHREVSCSLD